MMSKNIVAAFLTALIALTSISSAAYTVPANGRVKYNLDIGWKLNKGDVTGAQATTYSDASWSTVSLPYCWNQDDAFAKSVSTGIAWYRKHFSIPATYAGSKVFVEFEEIRQAGKVYCNGDSVGLSENGVMASGFDITSHVHIDGTDNVLAVRTDNSYSYVEESSGTGFQWNRGSYTTNFGGITQNVYLHITPTCYQTLPLYTGLKTVGPYIYGTNYSISAGSATINASSQVKNESSASQTVSYQVDIVDNDGNLVKTLTGAGQAIAAGATATVTATGTVTGLNFWNIGYGYLYDVYTMLLVGGTVTDVVKTRTGFRKMDYSNGIAKINDRMLHVKGFAWRSQNPWPALGDGVPAWMVGFQDSLMLALGANTVRPMQVCALRPEIEAGDRMGLSYAMPAGDAEGDVTGRQWNQREEVMRDAMVYSRNNPCVFWYESGNADITDAQMQEMVDTIKKYDPSGGRVIGCRGMLGSTVAQYGGEMMYIDKSTTKPMWMMEYSRNESPRRWWDQYSPPEFHVNDSGTASLPGYNMNQDAYIREECNRWYEYWTERPGTGTGTGTRYNQGGVKIEMCDGTTFARSSENYRRSGVVDAMRIPKDSYGAFKVFWNGWVEVDNKDVYIVGHWTYPTDTKKDTVFVVSNCDKVELFVNNVSKGLGQQEWKFLFTFPNVPYAAGTVKAVGYNSAGTQMAQDQISTVGAAAAIRLTARTSPAGLLATGADIALFDAEVIDANGNRCPTASNTITYAVSGQGEYRGGMAGNHTGNYILATSFPVECGISRISVRASSTPGTITVTASSSGLTGASATVTSTAVPVTNGLTTVMPNDGLPLNLPPLPPYKLLNPMPATLTATTTTSGGANTYDDDETTSWSGSTITYNLGSTQMVSQVHIKFTTFKNDNSYKVSVGGTQVWSGTTPGGLGYSDATFTPTSGSTVTIAAASGNLSILEAEIYGPGTVGVQPTAGLSAITPRNFIKKYHDRVNILVPSGDYRVSLVDLFGRVVFANQRQQKGISGMVSIATNKLARGVYLIDVMKDKQSVQKEVLFVQ